MRKQGNKTPATFWGCLKQFFKAYDFSMQVILAVSLGCAIFLLDYYDIPSQIIINTPGGVLCPIICTLAMISVVWLIDLHVRDLFAIASENALDVAATVAILASIFYIPARVIVLGKCVYIQISACIAVASLLVIAIRLAVRLRRVTVIVRTGQLFLKIMEMDEKIESYKKAYTFFLDSDIRNHGSYKGGVYPAWLQNLALFLALWDEYWSGFSGTS